MKKINGWTSNEICFFIELVFPFPFHIVSQQKFVSSVHMRDSECICIQTDFYKHFRSILEIHFKSKYSLFLCLFKFRCDKFFMVFPLSYSELSDVWRLEIRIHSLGFLFLGHSNSGIFHANATLVHLLSGVLLLFFASLFPNLMFFVYFFRFLFQSVDNMNAAVVIPDSATIFAAICACVFVVVGVAGKFFFSFQQQLKARVKQYLRSGEKRSTSCECKHLKWKKINICLHFT